MTHVVRPLADDELDEAVAVASRAFWPDPMLGFFSRGLLHEYQVVLPTFFRADVSQLRRHAELTVVDHGGRIGALAAWVAPDQVHRPILEQVATAARSSFHLLRAKNRVKATRLLAEVERRRPTSGHWYLALLGTDPSAQGRGLGAALLAPVLARCDEEGVAAYLETQKESNVAWYARHGFQVTGTVEQKDTPKVWLLSRSPRAGS